MSAPVNRFNRKKVAIVGSGCSGIAALWALNRTYHDVHMYEAADRLGGHTNTVQWSAGKFKTAVDTGFIVLNTATYPNFINFLNKIGVETEPTEMTFGVSRDHGAFEWAGTNLASVFAQRRRIFSPRMWRMIFDIVRFNQFALDLLINDDDDDDDNDLSNHSNGSSSDFSSRRAHHRDETIGAYLAREGYSDAFRDDYLLPMAAAVWSTGPDKCGLDFPAIALVRFMWNHHLLSTVAARPQWLTIKEGAQAYIRAVMRGFPPNHLHLKTAVRQVTNTPDGRVLLALEDGTSEVFDHVVLATHGDQALALLGASATPAERAVLGCFQTSQNEAVLHSDTNFMPRSRRAWAAWNYLTQSSPSTGKANLDRVSLTYNMNILQHIPREPFGDVLVTLNPLTRPRQAAVQGRFFYSHPLYTPVAFRAQRALPRIQNRRGISYAGAWTNYGFHEDGFSSGLAVAQDDLGAKLPFEFKDSTYSRGRRPQLGLADYILRFFILLIHLFIVLTFDRFSLVGKKRRSVLNGSAKACQKKLN
ncbi:amine oxidase [Cordyceps fumosorosea ARSEF 2679]|uniref:Amine oxidase n=1 Tax=Cordyceps fumosorosea (strain ARSEF 2679) TaxID=1081104 RepID=A0A167M6L9_CORFA|nr:amine oxidase [Cordyceps fumosorosea ARSEF 2679]OAA54001.1 amine oxidase [Cordyceps fumosorosea ARSEF 2679]